MALTKCKECGNELSTKADACPKCGAKVRKTSIAAIGCLSILILFLFLTVVGMLSRGSSPSGAPATNSQGASVASAEPGPAANAQAVALSDLLGEYKDNEIRADALYKGKFIETAGRVGDVKKDILGDIFVTVGTGRDFEIPQVQCFFDKSKAGIVTQLTN